MGGADPGALPRAGLPAPAFAKGAGRLLRCEPERLPAGYAAGWRYSAPVADMPAYLEYLLGLVRAGGGKLELGPPAPDLAGLVGGLR